LPSLDSMCSVQAGRRLTRIVVASRTNTQVGRRSSSAGVVKTSGKRRGLEGPDEVKRPRTIARVRRGRPD
jgi:hypothetical protein